MGALPLLVATLLAADVSNGVVVVVGRRTDVTVSDANGIAAEVSRAMVQGKVPMAFEPAAFARRLLKLGVKDTSSCAGKKQCVAELARQLQVPWSVMLSLSRVDAERAVALELIRTADQTVAVRESLVLSRTDKFTPELLTSFVEKVRVAMGLVAPPKVEEVKPPDAPVEVALVPPPPPPPPPLEVAAPVVAPKSHTTSLVLGGAGIAALVTGMVLTAVAMSARAQLTQGEQVNGQTLSSLTGAQALAINNTTSAELGAGAAVGAVGLGLGVSALLLW